MKPLTDSQLKSLSSLWEGLPEKIRQQLLVAAGNQGRLAETLKSLEKNRNQTAGKDADPSRLFSLFADVTGQVSDPPSHSRFTPEILDQFVTEADLSSLPAPNEFAGPDAMQAWKHEAALRLRGLIDRAEADKKLKARLTAAFGAGFALLIEDAACLLSHDAQLSAALKPFDPVITDLTPELATRARDSYDDICSEAPEASLWFLKILTARLTRTAQIFRVVEKIGLKSDDALVSKTDLADVGDLVLANADFYAGQFNKSPATIEEADAAGHALEQFVKVSVGMTREFGIRKDGRWGKTLFAIRAKASTALEEFFKKVETDFPRALPHVSKGSRGLAKPGSLPKEDIILKTEAQLRLLAVATQWSSQAAVGSSQKHAADAVRQEMDDTVRAFLEILRAAEGEDVEKATAALDICVRYMHAFNDDENADLIQRRSVAVRANAA